MAAEILPVTNDGEGHWTVDLGSAVVLLTTRYNYRQACWVLDVQDAAGVDLVTGIMLVPDCDLLKAFPQLKILLGGTFRLYERHAGAYRSPDGLGDTTKLVWLTTL